MQAFYDSKPPYLEAVGNGSYVYRFNIEEVVRRKRRRRKGVAVEMRGGDRMEARDIG